MKKNFFKKLSFVLALAMIVTALAPAAGAFAASKAPKLNAKEKTLFLSVDGKDEFDFNISNKKTGWKYLWTSANANVATVNKKNGVVVATGAGSTKVSVVITDKKGEEIDELTATILVRDNIKELTITNLPKDNKVAVGVAHDFNRSYKTVAGLTKGSQAVTRWTVSPSEKATISDAGVFTATEAGEYTITANAFQSKAKYTSWLADSTKYASYVTATATYKVTVAASMVSVKQTTLNKFDITFDTAVKADDVKKNLSVAYVVGTTKVKELVKGVSVDATGKIATVEMHLNLSKGSTYVVEYPEMGTKEFVAATTKLEDVVDIAILTKTAEVSKEKKIDIALYNKDGVNIGADDNLAARVQLEKKDNNLVMLNTDTKILYMYKIGDTVNLTATFHTYNWSEGKEVGNLVATGVVTCVEQSKDSVGTLNAYTLADKNPANFKEVQHTMFKGASKQLYVQLKGKNASGDELLTNNYDGKATATFEYKTDGSNVIIIGSNGSIYGVSEGTAVVVVYYDKVQVGACEVTVTSAQKVAVVTPDENSAIISNTIDEYKSVGVTVKDQLGGELKAGTDYDVEIIANNKTDAEALKIIAGASKNDIRVNANNGAATGVKSGSYGYTIKVTNRNDDKNTISVGFNVTVQDPGSAAVSYYKIEPSKFSYDMKSGDTLSDAKVVLKAYGYTASGIQKERVTNLNIFAAADVKVKNGDGKEVSITWSGAEINLPLVTTSGQSISGGAIINVVKTEPKGNWTITVDKKVNDKSVSPVSFEVKNTQTAVVLTINKTLTSKSSLQDMINDCFEFAVGDTKLKVDVATYGEANSVTYVQRDNNQYVLKKVYLYEQIGTSNNYIKHEVDMKDVIVRYDANAK